MRNIVVSYIKKTNMTAQVVPVTDSPQPESASLWPSMFGNSVAVEP